MTDKQTPWIVAGLTAFTLSAFPVAHAHPQEQPHEDAAIQNTPPSDDEPTLDDLLGLDDDGGADKPADKPGDDKPGDDKPDGHVDPELTRDLDKRLSGEEAATQFEQAIQEMEEVAVRLAEESDPGINTQRMQDEIILKLEQIIASAEKTQSQQQQQSGQQQPGKPREADKGGKPQQGQQPGEQQGQQQGQQQGEQQGQQQGQQQGDQQGQQQGDQQGQQQGDQNNPNDPKNGGGNSQAGSIRNADLISMKELREGEWGNLPPRLRDELAESLSETFNPVYRAATEAFYRRIAELSKQQAEEGGE